MSMYRERRKWGENRHAGDEVEVEALSGLGVDRVRLTLKDPDATSPIQLRPQELGEEVSQLQQI